MLIGLQSRMEVVCTSVVAMVDRTGNRRDKPGEVFATFHDPRVRLNRLTGPLRDGILGGPEYKITAVSIEPI